MLELANLLILLLIATLLYLANRKANRNGRQLYWLTGQVNVILAALNEARRAHYNNRKRDEKMLREIHLGHGLEARFYQNNNQRFDNMDIDIETLRRIVEGINCVVRQNSHDLLKANNKIGYVNKDVKASLPVWEKLSKMVDKTERVRIKA